MSSPLCCMSSLCCHNLHCHTPQVDLIVQRSDHHQNAIISPSGRVAPPLPFMETCRGFISPQTRRGTGGGTGGWGYDISSFNRVMSESGRVTRGGRGAGGREGVWERGVLLGTPWRRTFIRLSGSLLPPPVPSLHTSGCRPPSPICLPSRAASDIAAPGPPLAARVARLRGVLLMPAPLGDNGPGEEKRDLSTPLAGCLATSWK